MIKILIATPDKDSLAEFSMGLKQENVEILWSRKCGQALKKVEDAEISLVVVDESLEDAQGVECIEKIVFTNPFLNSALISSLSAKDFHETTEGLGVLMQVPVKPGKKEGEELFEYLLKILRLTNTEKKG